MDGEGGIATVAIATVAERRERKGRRRGHGNRRHMNRYHSNRSYSNRYHSNCYHSNRYYSNGHPLVYICMCVFPSLLRVIMSNFYTLNRSFSHYYRLNLPPKRQKVPFFKMADGSSKWTRF